MSCVVSVIPFTKPVCDARTGNVGPQHKLRSDLASPGPRTVGEQLRILGMRLFYNAEATHRRRTSLGLLRGSSPGANRIALLRVEAQKASQRLRLPGSRQIHEAGIGTCSLLEPEPTGFTYEIENH